MRNTVATSTQDAVGPELLVDYDNILSGMQCGYVSRQALQPYQKAHDARSPIAVVPVPQSTMRVRGWGPATSG